MANNNKHTIILMQASQNRATRTFMDYESISQAIDGMLRTVYSSLPAIRSSVDQASYLSAPQEIGIRNSLVNIWIQYEYHKSKKI
ncbi:hypothetical protein C5167_030640 [Papaver somniferum]|nr:hypothetical protein C5167_030640 [Papaver somniferum]